MSPLPMLLRPTTDTAPPSGGPVPRADELVAVVDLDEALGGLWPAVALAVAILVAVLVSVVVRRIRRRRRTELFATVVDGLETLLVTPGSVTDTDVAHDPDRADEVRDAGSRIDDALAELDRISRFETSAAALALRGHASELSDTLESRLRGEGDPYLLDVRITELRERARGARDRLDAAVGA